MRVSLTVLLVSAVLCTACSSDPETGPSPIPPQVALRGGGEPSELDDDPRAAGADGESLDELLAWVEGRPLTKTTLLRRLQLPEEDDGDPERQRDIQRGTLIWAKEQIFFKAAERAGLTLREGMLEDHVRSRMEERLAAASEEAEREVTQEEYLEKQGITWAEFSEKERGLLMQGIYLEKLLRGIGPFRPQIDLYVSPAEVRRVYADHPDAFDETAGVKFALFQVPFEFFEQKGFEGLDVDDKAIERAEEVKRNIEMGMTPEAVAKRHGMGKPGRLWQVTPDFADDYPDPQMKAWLLDPERKPGDAKVVPTPTGPWIFGVVETRPARHLPFEEVQDDIRKHIRLGKSVRLEALTMVELLTKGGSTVWPEELADALLADARNTLKEISKDDVWRTARLR